MHVHLRCEKGAANASTRRPCWKKWNQMCGQDLLLLIGLKVLIMMMTSLQSIFILSAQGFLMLMGSKYFWWRWPGYKTKRTIFCSLAIFIKNFTIIRKPWVPKMTMFCGEVISITTFKPIKSRRCWPAMSLKTFLQI